MQPEIAACPVHDCRTVLEVAFDNWDPVAIAEIKAPSPMGYSCETPAVPAGLLNQADDPTPIAI